MKKKCLAVAIILLFIGVAFSPSIQSNVVEEDLVEYQVEFCGLGRKHTVKLTQQETDEVEQLFDDIEKKLSEVETREEAEDIFKEAVVELNRFGLLGGLNVKQAQRLVTKHSKQLQGVNQSLLDNDSNYLCLIAGLTTNTVFFGRFTRIAERFMSFTYFLYDLYLLTNSTWLYNIVQKFGMFADFLWTLSWFTSLFSVFNPMPFKLWRNAGMGWITITIPDEYNPGGIDYYPAEGWVYSLGLNGVKSWNGTLWGNLPLYPNSIFLLLHFYGILSFSGIKIGLGEVKTFYFGSALRVKIGSEPPEF